MGDRVERAELPADRRAGARVHGIAVELDHVLDREVVATKRQEGVVDTPELGARVGRRELGAKHARPAPQTGHALAQDRSNGGPEIALERLPARR